jgi:hypothetical protein
MLARSIRVSESFRLLYPVQLKTIEQMSTRLERKRWLLPIFLLAFLVQSDVLKNWFVASDTLPLIETSRVSNLDDFIGIFTQPLMSGSDFVNTALFYRPVATLSYAADYALWGLNPFGYHLTNVVLHAVAVMLVAVAVTSLTDRPAVGRLTAILFALHPVTVEVVPVTARRQDILWTVFALGTVILFVRWYRGFDRWADRSGNQHRLLGGALIAYALALGSKETAVVVMGLVAAWVLLQNGIDRPRRTLRTLIATVGPFVVVTLLYLVLRIIALNGLGGYSVETGGISLLDIAKIPVFAVKYVLWLTYPLHFVEKATAAVSGGVPLVVLIPVVLLVGGVAVMRLGKRGYFRRKRFQRLRVVSPIATIVGFAAIPLVLTQTPLALPTLPNIPEILSSYVLGVLFVGACLGVISTTVLTRGSPFDGAIRRQLLFFGCWAILPFAVLTGSGFVMSQPWDFGFGIRNGYFAVIPAMAILSLLLLPTLRKIRQRVASAVSDGGRFEWRTLINTDVARAAGIALLVIPLIATSPLLYSSSGWQAAGELNERSLQGLNDAIEDTPNETPIYIADFPNEFDEQQRPYPHAHSVTPLRPYSLEAWLELHGRSANTQIRLVRKRTVAAVPDDISFRTEKRNGWTAVWTTMNGTRTVDGPNRT